MKNLHSRAQRGGKERGGFSQTFFARCKGLVTSDESQAEKKWEEGKWWGTADGEEEYGFSKASMRENDGSCGVKLS